jgi:hypothetical protein
MTIDQHAPAEAAPGGGALYGTAAALAVTAERLADAIDDNRPDWLHLAETAEYRLNCSATTRPSSAPAPGGESSASPAAA